MTTRTLLVALCLAGSTRAQLIGEVPEDARGVAVVEHLDGKLPLGLRFRDDKGRVVRLGELFDGARPVLLSLNYSTCPMLCQLQLQGLVRTAKQLEWDVGENFRIVSVSLDPQETVASLKESKMRHLREYGRPGSQEAWHFLLGRRDNIDRLADAMGVSYHYIRDERRFAHPAVLLVCTPDGRISRYLYGVDFTATTLRLSLVEAAEGKIGSTLDQVLLTCFVYDPNKNNYGWAAWRTMRLGAVLTAVLLVIVLVPSWLSRKLPGKDVAADAPDPADAQGAVADPGVAADGP